MRGDPLHLCAAGHEPIWFRSATCPFCALQQRIAALEAEIATRLSPAEEAGPDASTDQLRDR